MSDIEQIVDTLKQPKMAQVIAGSLPAHVPFEKFMAAAVSAFRTSDPTIFQDCDRQSIYNSVAQAARLGLLIDGRHGWLVPFRTRGGPKRCQFMIGPQGIIDSFAKARITCYATSVYESDEVRLWDDEHGQHVVHEFDPFSDRGKRIGAFAAARSADGRTWVEAMGMADIAKVKAASKQKDANGRHYGPWVDWEDRMEQKSCLHRLARRVPGVDVAEDDEYREDAVKVVQVQAPDRKAALHSLLEATPGAPPVLAQGQSPRLPTEPSGEASS